MRQSYHWTGRWRVGAFGWGANDVNRQVEIYTLLDGSRWTVARVADADDPEALGIAHLMAAAPELRTALEALRAWVVDAVPDEIREADESLSVIFDAVHTALGAAGTAGLVFEGHVTDAAAALMAGAGVEDKR